MSKCLEAREHRELKGLKEIYYGWMINVKERIANGWGWEHGPNYARLYKSCWGVWSSLELHQMAPLKVISKGMTWSHLHLRMLWSVVWIWQCWKTGRPATELLEDFSYYGDVTMLIFLKKYFIKEELIYNVLISAVQQICVCVCVYTCISTKLIFLD